MTGGQCSQLTHVESRLLDSGSTPLVRNTAATQLADIQKAHPDELFNLLNRVVPHLRAKSWDTRIAATKALAGIFDYAEKWDPNSEDPVKLEIKEEGIVFIKPDIKFENGATTGVEDGFLTFEKFDIAAVLRNGKTLLGSSGKEYDYSLANLDPAERLALQKKRVTASLGLGGEYMEDDLVTDKDFAAGGAHMIQTPRIDTSARRGSYQPSPSSAGLVQSPIEGLSTIGQKATEEMSAMSRRKENVLKRKAKMTARNNANKVRVVDLGERRTSTVNAGDITPHPIKTETSDAQDYFSLDTNSTPDDSKIVVEHKGPAVPPSPLVQTSSEDPLDWPFERLCELLLVDLFDHSWEIRHGAAMGLREVVRAHAYGAGRVRGKSRRENDALNLRWLNDLACRLCCIFMLDRFGDYVSDTVRSFVNVYTQLLTRSGRRSYQRVNSSNYGCAAQASATSLSALGLLSVAQSRDAVWLRIEATHMASMSRGNARIKISKRSAKRRSTRKHIPAGWRCRCGDERTG